MIDTDFVTAAPPIQDSESLRASIVLMQQELAILDAADVVAIDPEDAGAIAFACTMRGNELLERAAAIRSNCHVSGRIAKAEQAERIGLRNLAIAGRFAGMASGKRPVVMVASE